MSLITQSSRTPGPAALPYHVGIIVADLRQAMAELHDALGTSWRKPIVVDSTASSPDGPIRLLCHSVYSIEGPPYLELGEFDRSLSLPREMAVGAMHIGYWSEDVSENGRCFENVGMAPLFDIPAAPAGAPIATFHVARCGLVVEVVEQSLMAGIVGEAE